MRPVILDGKSNWIANGITAGSVAGRATVAAGGVGTCAAGSEAVAITAAATAIERSIMPISPQCELAIPNLSEALFSRKRR